MRTEPLAGSSSPARNAQQRGFSAATRTDNRYELASRDVQAHVSDDLDGRAVLRRVGDVKAAQRYLGDFPSRNFLSIEIARIDEFRHEGLHPENRASRRATRTFPIVARKVSMTRPTKTPVVSSSTCRFLDVPAQTRARAKEFTDHGTD